MVSIVFKNEITIVQVKETSYFVRRLNVSINPVYFIFVYIIEGTNNIRNGGKKQRRSWISLLLYKYV